MEVIYSLIPGMTFFGLFFVVILIIAVKNGQYEDMEGNASRMLFDDDDEEFNAHQRENTLSREDESPQTTQNEIK
ncbi:MAG: cbb3-type cytochrome oxidase assembly protein CcoS [Pseudomonadota bacterium]